MPRKRGKTQFPTKTRFPTITEKYGSPGGCTGFAPDAVFGEPLPPTDWFPMVGMEDMEADPGWFAPHLLAPEFGEQMVKQFPLLYGSAETPQEDDE